MDLISTWLNGTQERESKMCHLFLSIAFLSMTQVRDYVEVLEKQIHITSVCIEQ